MGITDVIKRAGKMLSNPNQQRGRKITADETELAVYKEKERLLNVKKELHNYRKKDGGILGHQDYGRFYGEKPINVIGAKNCFANKKKGSHSILNQRKVF